MTDLTKAPFVYHAGRLLSGPNAAGYHFYMKKPLFYRDISLVPKNIQYWRDGFFCTGRSKQTFTARRATRAQTPPERTLGFMYDDDPDAIWRQMRWVRENEVPNVRVRLATQQIPGETARRLTCKFTVLVSIKPNTELVLGESRAVHTGRHNRTEEEEDEIVEMSGVANSRTPHAKGGAAAQENLDIGHTFAMSKPVLVRGNVAGPEQDVLRGFQLFGHGPLEHRVPMRINIQPKVPVDFLLETDTTATWLDILMCQDPNDANIIAFMAGSEVLPTVSFRVVKPISKGDLFILAWGCIEANDVNWGEKPCPVIFGPRGCMVAARDIDTHEIPHVTGGNLRPISMDVFNALPETERAHICFQAAPDSPILTRSATAIPGHEIFYPDSFATNDRPFWYCIPISARVSGLDDTSGVLRPYRENELLVFRNDQPYHIGILRSQAFYRSEDTGTPASTFPPVNLSQAFRNLISPPADSMDLMFSSLLELANTQASADGGAQEFWDIVEPTPLRVMAGTMYFHLNRFLTLLFEMDLNAQISTLVANMVAQRLVDSRTVSHIITENIVYCPCSDVITILGRVPELESNPNYGQLCSRLAVSGLIIPGCQRQFYKCWLGF
jgi:hypothetical protein